MISGNISFNITVSNEDANILKDFYMLMNEYPYSLDDHDIVEIIRAIANKWNSPDLEKDITITYTEEVI